MSNSVTKNSRRLAYLLRHSDLPNHKGWVSVDEVLHELRITLHILKLIVKEDTKGRFEFSEEESSVRAMYGHSINVDLGLKPTVPPTALYHGTAEKYLNSIMQEGLRPRKRNFVHLSETIGLAMQVGSRHGHPNVLSVDTEAMIRTGYNFYKAQNGIWLTGEILPKFLSIVSCE